MGNAFNRASWGLSRLACVSLQAGLSRCLSRIQIGDADGPTRCGCHRVTDLHFPQHLEPLDPPDAEVVQIDVLKQTGRVQLQRCPEACLLARGLEEACGVGRGGEGKARGAGATRRLQQTGTVTRRPAPGHSLLSPRRVVPGPPPLPPAPEHQTQALRRPLGPVIMQQMGVLFRRGCQHPHCPQHGRVNCKPKATLGQHNWGFFPSPALKTARTKGTRLSHSGVGRALLTDQVLIGHLHERGPDGQVVRHHAPRGWAEQVTLPLHLCPG